MDKLMQEMAQWIESAQHYFNENELDAAGEYVDDFEDPRVTGPDLILRYKRLKEI